MTSPTSPRPRTAVAAVTALAGALTLAACSSGGKDDTPRTPTPTASASASASGNQSPGTTPAPSGDLEGNWLTTHGGKAIVLVISGKQAGLFTTGGSVCSGEAQDRTIHLKCGTGSGTAGTRTTGRVDSVDKSSMKVTWEGDVGTETYTRSEDGKVPPRLPTAGLGQ